MKNSVGRESAGSKKAERPSLYDGAVGAGHASDAFSILDALDAPAKTSGVTKWMLGLVVTALLGTTFVLYSAKKAGVSFTRQVELTVFAHFFNNKSEKEMPGTPMVTGTQSSLDFTIPSTGTKSDTPQPARTAVVFPSSSMPPDREQQGAMVMEASLAQPVPKIASDRPAALGTTSEPALTPSAKHPHHESYKGAKPATPKPVRQKSASKDRSSAKAGRVSRSHVQGKKNDRDVDLIVALLSHVGAAGSDRRGPAAVPARKTNIPSREGLSGSSSKSGGAPPPGRDVVLQSAGDTTDTLVKRCQALGFFEGQLCRIRICSGLWGKDAACPVNSMDRLDS